MLVMKIIAELFFIVCIILLIISCDLYIDKIAGAETINKTLIDLF